MKKILAMMLCTVMTLSLAACGADKGENQISDATSDLVSENVNETVSETVVDVTDTEGSEDSDAESDSNVNAGVSSENTVSNQESGEEVNKSGDFADSDSYSQLIGTWEEDSDLTYRARYTFCEDGKVKLEYTESEGADCGENAKFDGVNATWEWTTGDLAGFGGALGPMEGFDGNSFTIPAANAYEEAKRFIKTNQGQKENQTD